MDRTFFFLVNGASGIAIILLKIYRIPRDHSHQCPPSVANAIAFLHGVSFYVIFVMTPAITKLCFLPPIVAGFIYLERNDS